MPLRGSSASDRRFWLKVWGGVFGCLGVLDIWRMTKHDESTLSESIRRVFRTDTLVGRALFLTALVIFARHILK